MRKCELRLRFLSATDPVFVARELVKHDLGNFQRTYQRLMPIVPGEVEPNTRINENSMHGSPLNAEQWEVTATPPYLGTGIFRMCAAFSPRLMPR